MSGVLGLGWKVPMCDLLGRRLQDRVSGEGRAFSGGRGSEAERCTVGSPRLP